VRDSQRKKKNSFRGGVAKSTEKIREIEKRGGLREGGERLRWRREQRGGQSRRDNLIVTEGGTTLIRREGQSDLSSEPEQRGGDAKDQWGGKSKFAPRGKRGGGKSLSEKASGLQKGEQKGGEMLVLELKKREKGVGGSHPTPAKTTTHTKKPPPPPPKARKKRKRVIRPTPRKKTGGEKKSGKKGVQVA